MFLARLTLPLLLAMAGCSLVGGDRGAPPPAAADTRRGLATGEIVGIESDYGSHAWLGIPFARPPVGELRWRAPQPPGPWQGLRRAAAQGPPCPQQASPFGGVEGRRGRVVGSEDCLYLNVWSPRFPLGKVPTGRERLPVMLWIHGGGNTVGYAGLYHGGHLAARHDLVVVTTNYRLGPLGWFRHPAVTGELEDPRETSGNFGLLDQLRALHWIRENIAAFGGDPGNITLFGESAGGRNVLALLASPSARGSFHRAIAQSGGTRSASIAEAENLVDAPKPGHRNSSGEVLLRLLVAEGKAPDRQAARARVAELRSAQIAGYLRARSPDELFQAYLREDREGLLDVPQVIRDGKLVPAGDLFASLTRRGGRAPVPTLLGTNRDEEKIFLVFHPDYSRRLFNIPLWRRDRQRYELTAEYRSKLWKADGADELAQRWSRQARGRVYVYRFDWDEQPRRLWADLASWVGAAHGLEIPFVFGHWDSLGRAARVFFDAENEAGRLELSERMMSYWAQFAYTGDPGRGRSGDLPQWQAWRARRPGFLILDTEADGGLRMSEDVMTRSRVVAEIEADPRLTDPVARCSFYAELAREGRGFSRADYASAGCGTTQPVAGAAPSP